MAWLLLGAATSVYAQIGFGIPPLPSGPANPPKVLDHYPDKPSGQLAFTIPLASLGFSTAGDSYMLRQQSLVSLDFLDEDRVLFSFHVPSGLIKRQTSEQDAEQRIRALVVDISTSKVNAQAEWAVPDRSRYLWMLNDGHFLLRTNDGLDEGDARLETESYLRSPGKLMWIQLDPKQDYIITNWLLPGNSDKKNQNFARASKGSKISTNPQAEEPSMLVVRTIKRSTREVVRETSLPWANQKNDWPMNSEGYLERVHEKGANWALKLSSYAGASERVIGRLESTCLPTYSFVSDHELLVSRCDPERGLVLEAVSASAGALWQRKAAANAMWPIVIPSNDGTRIAYESLLLKHAADKYKRMIGAGDLLGQSVKVFNAADGSMVLEAPLTPVLDGGGNVAISPSGRRVAIINAGALQVFGLPTAPKTTVSK